MRTLKKFGIKNRYLDFSRRTNFIKISTSSASEQLPRKSVFAALSSLGGEKEGETGRGGGGNVQKEIWGFAAGSKEQVRVAGWHIRHGPTCSAALVIVFGSVALN